ncbi:MAG: hypothetical protein ACE3JP_14625 [Ectobacillus sp.]
MRNVWFVLFIMLLTACSAVPTEERNVMEIKVEKITILKTGAEAKEKTLTTPSVIRAVMELFQEGKLYNIEVETQNPDYIAILQREDGKQEKYDMWLHVKDRKGWMKRDGQIYRFSEDATNRLLALFSFEEAVPKKSGACLTEVTKRDLQIVKFLIQADGVNIRYTVSYKISDSLYNILAQEPDYYFVLMYPAKVQRIIGAKQSGAVKGEAVKYGRKEYRVQFVLPVKEAKKGIERLYEGYDLLVLNREQQIVGKFINIIQIVKEHGEKTDLQQ